MKKKDYKPSEIIIGGDSNFNNQLINNRTAINQKNLYKISTVIQEFSKGSNY